MHGGSDKWKKDNMAPTMKWELSLLLTAVWLFGVGLKLNFSPRN